MRSNWKMLLVAGLTSLGAFGVAFAMGAPSSRERLEDAMQLVQRDSANTVCASGSPCVAPEAPRTLLVFFSPRDCAVSLYQTAVLDSLYRAVPRGKLNIVGIARDMDASAAAKFAAVSGINYPIYLNAARFEGVFGNPRPESLNKPVLLLLGASGEILHSYIAGASIRSHYGYMTALEKFGVGAP